MSGSSVVLLAGGTGGGKLAAGLQDVVGEDLTVVVNTADDLDMHGLRVCPDPDLVTYWLAGVIDERRGWGIRDDGFAASGWLERLGAPGWFRLSDRDLATCLFRTGYLAEGGSYTDATAQVAQSLGVRATVLPMCEERVSTRVRTAAGWRDLQQFLILERGESAIEAVELDGIERARMTSEVAEAIAAAQLIVIGPSNPVISIGPILAVAGMREAIAAADAPVVGVSPLVAGRSVKGPTEAFIAAAGEPVSAAGVASLYSGVIGGLVMDSGDPEPGPKDIPVVARTTLMSDADARRHLARAVLDFGLSLSSA
ncbi:MAG TPA: 2-phospho-L-lactate transferase [Solirubrobacterales bacterium]|nr:2-phospho-L-lactate transferase [Solirubrobacterales bacterium]